MFVVSIVADLQTLAIQFDEEGNEYIPLPYFEGGWEENIVLVTGSNGTILTNGGNDIVISIGQNNYTNLGDGNDFAIAYESGAFFFGDSGDDVLIGGDGDDWLNGGGGADMLIGGDGDDIIVFDINDKSVSGGKGQDTFVFEQTTFNHDVLSLTGASLTQESFFQQMILSGAVHIADFNADEGDVLDMSAMNIQPWNVYSNTETNMTVFVGDDATVVLIGVSFYDVNSAIQSRDLVFDNGGKG